MMKIIKTETDYEAALERIEELMDTAPGTPEEDELDVLALLVETYEKKQYPIGMPEPVEAILFFMDQQGLSNADMVTYLGSPSKVSEVLNGKRGLSKTMIKNLVEGLGIPAEILLEVSPAVNAMGYVSAFHEYLISAKQDVDHFIPYAEQVCRSSYDAKADYASAMAA